MPSTAHLTPFDTQTGRIAGLRSAEVRLELLEKGRAFTEAAKEAQEPTEVQLEVQRQIELTNEQVARTRDRLNDDKAYFCEHCERGEIGDKDRAALLRELRGLMEHLCRLRGVSQAPQSKPTSKPTATRARPFPEPVPSEPTPSPTSVSIPVQAVDTQHKE